VEISRKKPVVKNHVPQDVEDAVVGPVIYNQCPQSSSAIRVTPAE
jgi:hypothetical protein